MKDLLLEIKKSGIRINVNEENLKLKIPKNFNNDSLLENIKKNKLELIDYVENSKSKSKTLQEIPQVNSKFSKLTPSQLRMFLAEGVTKGTNVYNIPFAYELRGALDVKQLQKAFVELIQRHESLRTYFVLNKNHEPIQKILENFDFKLEYSSCTEEELEKIKQDFSYSFDLDKAPLIRAKLLKLDKDLFVLLVDIHHIVFDGISLKIFMKELFSIYNNVKLPELKLKYIDYATWFNGEDYRNNLNTQKEFWINQLKGYANTAILPSDFKKKNEVSFEGAYTEFSITDKRKEILEQLAKKYKVSLFSVLTCLYSILQAKLTGVDDLAIGTPVAGRRHWSVENIIGMFVNTLAIRVLPKSDLRFNDYLTQVSASVMQSFDNQEYPYETLLGDLGTRNNTQNNSLFNSLITLVNFAENIEFKTGNLNVRPLEFDKSTAKFDLSMYFIEKEDEISCSFEYNTQLFKKNTIEQFFDYFVHIVDQVSLNESINLGQISLLDQNSSNELIKLNDFTNVDFPKDVTLVDLFESQVDKTPNNVALIFGEETMTYNEVNQNANKVARMLREKGVGRNDAIGVLMEKNMQVVISMLGILKAGGAYVPIDVTYPQDRIDYIIENSQLKWALVSEEYLDLISKKDVEVINVLDTESFLDTKNLPKMNHPEDLCYVIYTSGTTGNPKGVMVEHKNVVRLFFNEEFQYDFNHEDVWTMFHSYCFDWSVWEMYGALLYGGKLVIVSHEEARDPLKYLDILQKHKVTVLNQTPTGFYSLNNTCEKQKVVLSGIRYVIFGGEALTPSKLKRWKELHPMAKLINMYGITEGTVHMTYKEIGIKEIENGIGNIGKALPTASIYLLDQNMNQVPVGIIGEMYLGGEGVSRGYINNKELTDSYFIKNPFKEGGRLYKSGDLAVLLPNGDLEYKGRIDRQVQVKGFRVELKEIEHHLNQHKLIDDAIVFKTASEKEEPSLCAYYIAANEIDVSELRVYLEEKLPHYMIPSYYVKIKEVPFTSNNKIDIARLPEPKTGLSSNKFMAPTNEEETLICKIWQECLEVDQVGILDNFFTLGGDSLKAIGVISKINERLSSSLSIADLYSHPTVEELVAVQNPQNLEEENKAMKEAQEQLRLFQERYKEENGFPDIYEEVYPMNGVEMGMVFHSLQTKSDDIHEILYHEQNLYDIPEKDFSFQRFKKVIHLLCQKHGELRKIFDLDNFAHIIKKEIDPEINFIDICHLSKEEQKAFITQKMHEEKLRRTELSFSLIWRMNVIKIRDDYQYLLFDFNHSLFDGWSLSSFLTELQKTHLRLAENENYTPKKLLCSYEDQIIGELAASKKESSIAYWQKELDGYTRFELPPTGLKHESLREVCNFGKDFRKQLEAVAEKHNTSFKHLCFSAFVYTLRILSYGNDITTGMATNIRPLVNDAEQLLGCFLNTIPFRAQIPEGLTWGEYIDLIESKLRTLKYHERVPFHKMLEIAEEGRSEKNPIFDVFFNYIDFRIFNELQPAEETIEEEETTLQKDYLNDHALCTTSIFAQENDFIFALIYSTSFLTKEQAKAIAGYFKNTLDQFIYSPGELMNKQAILAKNPMDTIVSEEDKSTVTYSTTATLVSLFEEQVAKTPNKKALVFEDKSLTYSELNNLSNAIAEELRLQGVGRDTIVGLFMDKNLYTVVCQLGVLKAGGCYLPIDPSYPKERIDYILADSNLNILVTNKVFEGELDTSIYKIVVEEIIASVSGKEVSNPERINLPNDMCYIIYTSGTTGNPKGVMVEHRNIVRLFFNDKFQFDFGQEDVWTMFHSHCFDFSVWEMYGALLFGGKLVLVSHEEARDPLKYLDILQKHKVTVLNQTPTAFDSLRTVCAQKDITLSDLRYVIFGGEALTPLKLKDWYAKHSNVKLVNMYGITEIAIHATYKEIGEKEIESNISNIGNPIPATSIYLLDSDMNLQPPGAIGEIYISGLGVTRGYLNKEELTAARFIENPNCKGERLYRSGDLGRLLENGEIEYLGRIDNQVQLKGFRIELKEIEYHLLRHEEIEEAIVVLKDSNKDQPYLCAYYVTKEANEINDFRSYLGEFLPTYMIPSYFVRLDEIPFTSNNKIAISKLPEPEAGILKDAYVAPTNEMETKTCNIWANELGVEKVGMRDNYFSLGGDSLRAIGLISAMNKELDASFTIADLYSFQTIGELMSVQTSGTNQDKDALEAAREEVRLFQKRYKEENGFPDIYEEVYPMSGIEMGMVFLSLQTKSDDIHEIIYHEQNLYDLPGKDFSFQRFKKVIHLLCQKHGELRKIFDLDNYAHIIKKEIDPEINFIDICHLSKEEQEAFITQKLHEGKLRRTELSFSLIWRMNVIKIRDDYQYLLFEFNHASFDGWSLSSFLTEIQKTYLRLVENENYTPKKLLSSYEDQIIGELAASKKESSIAYWQKELNGYTRFELPPTGLKHKFFRDQYNFGKDFRKQLEAVAEKHNTSFKHLCFSAYIYMLRILSYGNDITAGITTNNRPLVQDAEQLLGCFLNTVPFRAQIPKELTWGEYIAFIENKLRELKYHEQAPFHKILEMVNEVSSEKNPIFDVSFDYVDFRIYNELQPSEETVEEEETTITKSYMNDYALLGVRILATYNDFGFELAYSTSFITEEQSIILSNCFKNILKQFVYNSDEVINKKVVLKESCRSIEAIESFNDTAVDNENDKTVLDLFKEQVALTPDAEAIIFGEEKLTYKELDLRSNFWASNLITSGVVPGAIVGLMMTRSSEMITAILAVMKTGAAYLTINPGLPGSRTAHMIEDSGCSCIITNIDEKPIELESYSWIGVEELELDNGLHNKQKLPNVEADSLAYILYTSGSTGKPKGCMISHANLFNYIFWSNNYYFENSEEGNWGLMTPMSFDLSITAIFTSLTRGKKLYLCNETKSIDQLLVECFTNPAIDTLKITPTHVNILKDLEIYNTNIKTIICGGEQLKKTHIEILKNINKNIKVYNEYGPTETTVGCTVAEVTLEDDKISVGSPIANTKLYILDTDRKAVPIGVVGEMYVSGAGVSKGYIGNSVLTAERFVSIDNSICYKTGDFARWLPNGTIEYFGRIDNQIKLRGYRIELGEIENSLMGHPQISYAIVINKPLDNDECLIAYCITDQNYQIEIEELKDHLLESLPEYMVPSYFVEIAEIPLTSNGKLDKSSLPQPEVLRLASHVDPSNETEERLLAIWSGILKVEKERISVTTSFFDIGGNSLKALMLANLILKTFSIEISIKEFFEMKTIKEMANYIMTVEQLNVSEQSQLKSAKVIL